MSPAEKNDLPEDLARPRGHRTYLIAPTLAVAAAFAVLAGVLLLELVR